MCYPPCCGKSFTGCLQERLQYQKLNYCTIILLAHGCVAVRQVRTVTNIHKHLCIAIKCPVTSSFENVGVRITLKALNYN